LKHAVLYFLLGCICATAQAGQISYQAALHQLSKADAAAKETYSAFIAANQECNKVDQQTSISTAANSGARLPKNHPAKYVLQLICGNTLFSSRLQQYSFYTKRQLFCTRHTDMLFPFHHFW